MRRLSSRFRPVPGVSVRSRFLRDRQGNVAILFAFSLIPLSMAGLGVVDFQRASAVKVQMQDALDAAALAAARSTAVNDADLQTIGDKVLAANLRAFPSTTLKSSSFTSDGSGTVSASAQASVSTLVAGMFLGGDLTVGASTSVVRANNKIELALVLDNTGSMAGTKLSNLKTAASNLVDTLMQAAKRSTATDAVKISLVPFSMTVNVGSTYRNASWLDQNAVAPINDEIFTSHANRFTLLNQMGVAWGGCVESRQQPWDVDDTGPSTAVPASLVTPYFAPDEPDPQSSGKNGDFGSFYNNYLTDGTYSSTNWKVPQGAVTKYNKAPKSGTNSSTGYVYGPNAGCSMAPLMRLTADGASLKTAIQNMSAVGDTNIPMGLMWGWHTLSPNNPFGDGVPYGTSKTTKIVILMTDGQNQNTSTSNSNASYYSGDGYIWQNRLGVTGGTTAQRTSALDNRLSLLCSNMKARGVEIYTVRVEVTSGSSVVLQNCATSPTRFYDVTNSNNLNTVFQTIAGSIANLHLSH